MLIKYEPDGRGTVDKYIKFRLDFITKICSTISTSKTINDKDIKSKLYNYYIMSKFEKVDFDEMINDSNSSLRGIFVDNNIRIKEIQDICFSLIDINTLFEWKSFNDDKKEIEKRKSLIEMATTIYIALQYEKFILPKNKSDMTFEDISRNINNRLKGFIEVELIIKLNDKKAKLQRIFEEAVDKNSKFIDLMNQYTLFRGKLFKVNNPNNRLLFMSSLEYSIKELNSENKKDVSKISNKANIRTSLEKIEVDINSLFVVMQILRNTRIDLIINLSNEFFSNKANIEFLINRIDIIRKYVLLNVSLDVLEKYGEIINSLKLKGFTIILHQNEKNVEKELKMKDISWCEFFILKFKGSSNYEKNLALFKNSKVIPIVLDVPNKNVAINNNLEYYILQPTGGK